MVYKLYNPTFAKATAGKLTYERVKIIDTALELTEKEYLSGVTFSEDG